MLPLLPLRLCRLWPRSPPSRLLETAAGQRSRPRNYYDVLGVHPGASTEEVKRAFFAKSKELHPDRDPGNPALHNRFVELNEAYHVLSHEQSRCRYDDQLRSPRPPKSPGTTARDKSTRQTHSSWEHPNAQYWSQFHHVRPQGPQARQQQHKYNQQVLRYCLLLMLAGMGLHYVVFRMVERMHLNFMDEKDRIITAMYNEARARARSVPALFCPPAPCPGTTLGDLCPNHPGALSSRANRASLQQKQQWQKQQQPPPPGPTQGPEIVPPGSGP
ncbi:dnaJ homolog subfamily C member 4 isoform X2 [Saimiri boliviensis]|uniref:dnaJ homolog subfamily C member 4 isoform X2 n=1 Tax=Saimiri boliviensis TaxID=27679 RepID=UPI000533EF1B|nr:dnaJ homolog subfamily C member 4 isoform X2 [Saimiri boliviensis boliviensis]